MGEEKVPVKVSSGNINQILIAVFVIVLTLVLFALYRRRKGSRRSILLTGLCDSGKTLVFSQLTQKKHVQTYTSIKENIGTCLIGNEYIKIVDIPGHERLRDRFFEEYKSSARGIVFVVDSLTVQQDIRDTAEFLYNVLTDVDVLKNTSNILILFNKQDQPLAKGSNAIRSMLEKELNTLRTTKSHQLESVDPKAKRTAVLGDSNKDFEFSNLPIKIDFAESFAFSKNGDVNIQELNEWLIQIC